MNNWRLVEAIAAFRKAIELDPNWRVAKGNLQGELIAAFRKAIELDPDDASAHYDLGDALESKGQLDEAIAEFRKAIELDPNYVSARLQPQHESVESPQC